jgi:hypothetical protein
MPTTNGNRPLLDMPRWEILNPLASTSSTGGNFSVEKGGNQQIFYNESGFNSVVINPRNGARKSLTASGLGTYSTGATSVVKNYGPGGTCFTNGTSTTLVTSENLARNLTGYKIMITSGPGAGDVRTIESNTIGANATVTVTSAFSASPTTSSTYRLFTPRMWSFTTSSTAAGSLRFYCHALNTWSAIGAMPVAVSGDSKLIAPNSIEYDQFVQFATGTATAGGANTITNSSKTWTNNQWANHQIRITGGTGIGQIRTIASNTGTIITVSTNWTVNPDNTSTYSIEPNDDFIYWTGNTSTDMRRYSISGNSWTTLATRSSTTGSGLTANLANEITVSYWKNESNYLNGRYIYSFRGGGSAILDRYDIALNSWSNVTYDTSAGLNPTSGGYGTYADNSIYYVTNTGVCYEYNIVESNVYPFVTQPFNSGGSAVGDRVVCVKYIDGGTTIKYLYHNQPSSATMLRTMIIE